MKSALVSVVVHGGIRHLENISNRITTWLDVHGGIRHLENLTKFEYI